MILLFCPRCKPSGDANRFASRLQRTYTNDLGEDGSQCVVQVQEDSGPVGDVPAVEYGDISDALDFAGQFFSSEPVLKSMTGYGMESGSFLLPSS